MPSCLINQCNSSTTGKKTRSEPVTLHSFPKTIPRIIAWLQQTGQLFKDINALAQKIFDGKSSNKYRLCSLHFTPESYFFNDDFSRKFLSLDAVPSIFAIAKEGENIIEENLRKKCVKREKKQVDAGNQTLQNSIIVQRIKVEEEFHQDYPTSFLNGRLSAGVQTLQDVEITKIGFCNIETQTDDTLWNSLVHKEKQVVGSDVLDRPLTFDATVAVSMGLMSKLKLHMDSLLREVPIRFDDVAVYFSAEEWESLGMVEKQMYMDVMLENYYTLYSLGFVFEKPEIISIIEEFRDHCHKADINSIGVKEEPEYGSETKVSTGYLTSETSVGRNRGRLLKAQTYNSAEPPVCHSEAPTKQDLVDQSLDYDIQSFTVKEEHENYSETDVTLRNWRVESSVCRKQELLVRSQNCNGVEQPVYHAEDPTRQDFVDQSFYNAAQSITVKEEPEYYTEILDS